MRVIFIIPLVFALPRLVPAQAIFGGSELDPLLKIEDRVVLESGELRKDLPCTVTPRKTELDFDLAFQAGYDVSVPMRELEGGGDRLTVLFRVVPKHQEASPVYFSQKILVPRLAEKTAGDAGVTGVFELGEGSYHVDWLMRDGRGRFCATQWDIDATLQPKDRQMELALPSGAIRAPEQDPFADEPPVSRAQTAPGLNVKILVNFAPQNPNSAALEAPDRDALVSILRGIARNPQVGKFSLTAFNLKQETVLFREESVERIDFPALGQAVQKLKLGTVDASRLARKHADTDFLASLVTTEAAGTPRPDALVFVGPKVLLDADVPQQDLEKVGTLDYPVFYMNYELDPRVFPWKDTIGHVVKFFKGREFTISGPRDLWNAIAEMVSRVSRTRPVQSVAAN